ncbi:MAG: glycoside hydrolase family 127 protein, partial [Vicinamibacterales bacterium]
MPDAAKKTTISRRTFLERTGTVAAMSVAAGPFLGKLGDGFAVRAEPLPLNAIAGVDRIVMTHGRTYLNGWAGYGEPPHRERGRRGEPPPPENTGPAPQTTWSTVSGPGTVTFVDPKAAVTTAAFSAPGDYVLQVTADNGTDKATSTLSVTVEAPPPDTPLQQVVTTRHAITSPFWRARNKALITSWIPFCIDQMNRTDLIQGPGGIDNFVEAAKALRGEPHGSHKGYVFSNAWVHETVESMSLALMWDAQGDKEILAAQEKMRATLEDWIPKILAAQYPDGYLQTAFTLRNPERWPDRWTPQGRGNHEGYTAGYFIESAINHYTMTGHKDARLYDAAKRLADCWADHIGPPPKQEWFDGHQEMEQALVRFGRFVNEVEGGGKGDRYIALAKFLLDCRKGGTEYDQSHLPVVQQYEAVGHAVRAVYTYSGMADVAVETHDVDYQSAVKSLWDNIVNRKYYVTGGIASGETSEGFGPNYSLRNNSYCESCSSCGEIFFQWKMHLAYHDAKYADLYETTLYNGLLGSLDLEGKNYYYPNPLAANAQRTPWNVCPCCVGNLSRTMLMIPTWMYSKDAGGVYVNLFAGSDVTIPGVAGTAVELVQTTDYPWKDRVAITVKPAVPKHFAIHIRVPNRDVSALYTSTPAANGLTSMTVNGSSVKPAIANGYATIARMWKTGDTIVFTVPMPVQRVRAIDKVAADQRRVALRVGPLLYNIEQVDQGIDGVLDPSARLTTEWRPNLLAGVNVVTGTFADGSPLTAVPNYARYNRNPPAPPWVPPPPRVRPVPGA